MNQFCSPSFIIMDEGEKENQTEEEKEKKTEQQQQKEEEEEEEDDSLNLSLSICPMKKMKMSTTTTTTSPEPSFPPLNNNHVFPLVAAASNNKIHDHHQEDQPKIQDLDHHHQHNVFSLTFPTNNHHQEIPVFNSLAAATNHHQEEPNKNINQEEHNVISLAANHHLAPPSFDLFAAAAANNHDREELNRRAVYTYSLNARNYHNQAVPNLHLPPPSFLAATQALDQHPPHIPIRPRALYAAATAATPDQQTHNIPPIRPRASYAAAAAAATVVINNEEPSHNDQPRIPIIIQRAPRNRRNLSSELNEENEVFPPPFPWATDRYAKILSYDEILSKGICEITGQVQCKKCEQRVTIGFDLKTKFMKIGTYINEEKDSFHDRAPDQWLHPELPSCPNCDQPNSLKPVISNDKKLINWLFLLLGEMLGCCTLEQLKFFCKHTRNHRTGAKDRVLYLTYLALCKQLDRTGPFDR